MRRTGHTVITIAANKGGVGKSRMAILLANCLGASGMRVCVLDMDLNNSTTAYYLREENMELQKSRNMAKVIAGDQNSLEEFEIPTEHRNVSVIPSSRYLADFRTVEERRLKKIVGRSSAADFIVIDCQPDYNNLTINAMVAADYIITPVLKDTDSYDAALFLSEKLQSDYPEKYDSWFITINGYNRRWESSSAGKQKEYIDLYLGEFGGHVTPSVCWFPWVSCMNDIKDRQMSLSSVPGHPNSVCSPQLHAAVVNLAKCFINDGRLVTPEVF